MTHAPSNAERIAERIAQRIAWRNAQDKTRQQQLSDRRKSRNPMSVTRAGGTGKSQLSEHLR